MNLDVGSRIGDYEIIGVLGAGGMGKVFKVRNVISDRVEAMKVLLPNLTEEPDLADRFMREIKVQASLEHPHIAGLHTALRVENQLLMLMEFVEGETLDQRLKNGPLPVAEAIEYAAQVLAALAYAHSRGVVHRDIKPANMMLTPGGVVKLMDFGIAKATTDRKLTMTGTTLGSLYYMSPEQIQGDKALDARADLYSLGVSLYELVTGRRPFEGDSQFSIMSAHLQQAPPPPISVDPRLPASLNDVILLSLAKDPAQRFQTADAFRNALQSVAQALGMVKPAPAPAAPARPAAATPVPARSGGKRGLWMAVGAVAAVVALIAIVQFGPWRSSNAAAPQQAEQPAPAANPPVTPPAEQAAPPQTAEQAQTQAPAAAPAAVKQPQRTVAVPAQQTAAPQMSTATPAPQPQAQPAAPAGPSAAEMAARRAELQQVREHLVLLTTRAATVRASLNNMQRAQAASGLGLRGDIQEASSLMQTYFDGATSALNAGDAPAARSFMDKGERQLEKIEKFLGR